MGGEKELNALMASQYGCVSWEQAQSLGLSEDARRRRLGSGRWIRLRPTVYALSGSPDSWLRRMMAAVLWAGPGSAISHHSAARLWALDGAAFEVVELSTLRHLRPCLPADQVHRVGALNRSDLRLAQRLPVTSPERTLLDLASIYGRLELEASLDELLRRRQVSLRHLGRRLLLEPRRHPGYRPQQRRMDCAPIYLGGRPLKTGALGRAGGASPPSNVPIG